MVAPLAGAGVGSGIGGEVWGHASDVSSAAQLSGTLATSRSCFVIISSRPHQSGSELGKGPPPWECGGGKGPKKRFLCVSTCVVSDVFLRACCGS